MVLDERVPAADRHSPPSGREDRSCPGHDAGGAGGLSRRGLVGAGAGGRGGGGVSYKRMTPAPGSTRAALLDAATALFATHGYAATSVRAITTRARANLGAITYHFGSKAALFEAVLLRALTELGDTLTLALARRGPPLDRLERAFRAHFTFLATRPPIRGLVTQVVLRGDEIPPGARAFLRGLADRLAALIVEGQRDGSIRSGDPRVLTAAVMAPSLVLNVMRGPMRAGPGIDLDNPRRRRAVLTVLVRYLRAALQSREA
jgi:AcrR family transcriptional regulator